MLSRSNITKARSFASLSIIQTNRQTGFPPGWRSIYSDKQPSKLLAPPLDDRRPSWMKTLPEVVVIVLQELYKNSRNDFLVCMRVCQQWHGLAVPILWTDVFVQSLLKPASYSSLAAFTMSTPVLQRLSQIRSFTWLMAARTNHGIRLDLLARLARLLPHMTSLSCFSSTARMNACVLAAPEFIGILTSLPSTTRYLELVRQEDSPIVDLVDKSTFFEALGRILPQLASIRLGGVRVCSAFSNVMKIRCPCLRSISINFQEDISQCRCEIEKAAWDALDMEDKLAIDTIDTVLLDTRSAVDQGYLPHVRKLTLVRYNRSEGYRLGIFPTAFVVDVLRQSVQLFPGSGEYRNYWMRYLEPDTESEVDFFGRWIDIPELLKRSNWVTYDNNIRLPEEAPKASYLNRKDTLHWYSKAVAEVQEFHGDRGRGPAPELYYWEKLTNRSLLHVRTDHTLRVPMHVRRERPEEELSMEPGSEQARRLNGMFAVHR